MLQVLCGFSEPTLSGFYSGTLANEVVRDLVVATASWNLKPETWNLEPSRQACATGQERGNVSPFQLREAREVVWLQNQLSLPQHAIILLNNVHDCECQHVLHLYTGSLTTVPPLPQTYK